MFVVVLTCALIAPAAAIAGTYTLHPSGFGPHSYSAWKAGEGLADSTGNKDQALYFQKLTTTPTFAAGVAVIKGFEGLPLSSLQKLEFWRGTDGHCGAGAPRFDVFYRDTLGDHTLFIGCAEMRPGLAQTAPNGRVFEQRTYDAGFPDLGTITGIAIVFDEGNDVGEGFVYLDDVSVTANGVTHTWTSASDNGNGQTITQDPTGEVYLSSLLGLPLTLL